MISWGRLGQLIDRLCQLIETYVAWHSLSGMQSSFDGLVVQDVRENLQHGKCHDNLGNSRMDTICCHNLELRQLIELIERVLSVVKCQ